MQTLGMLEPQVFEPGPVVYNPLVSNVLSLPVSTQNLEVRLSLPSREGLTIDAEISILYRINAESVPVILEQIGLDYERSVVLSTFRSAAADVTSQHLAKDMHSGMRAEIASEIAASMDRALRPRGFTIEAVLLKSIVLPARLTAAIEAKLQAEQESQRMEFVLTRERQEAQRRVMEAEGIRDAQKVLNEGLTPMLIQYQTLEVFRDLARSPNAKVIFTDGRTPLLLPPTTVEVP
jgi:prohibitin 1